MNRIAPYGSWRALQLDARQLGSPLEQRLRGYPDPRGDRPTQVIPIG